MAKPDRDVAKLLAAAERAKASGEAQLGSYLTAEAAHTLTEKGKVAEAIDLYVMAREYGPAAELAKKQGDLEQAARLFFRAGDLVRAAEARLAIGEDVVAAELFQEAGAFAKSAAIFEERRDFVRAGDLYEKAGDIARAAELFARLITGQGTVAPVGAEGQEICRRAGVLFAQCGRIADAIQILRFGNQLVFAGKLLVRDGRYEEAIELLSAAGEIVLAAEACRKAGQEQRANILLAHRDESEGRIQVAAARYEQAGALSDAARCYELANDFLRAAIVNENAGQLAAAGALYERLGCWEEAKRCYRAAGMKPELEAIEEHTSGDLSPVVGGAVPGQTLRAAWRLIALAREGELSRYYEGIELLLEVAPEDGEYIKARTLLAEVYEEQGDLRKASEVLRELLRGVDPTPEHVPALYQYGRALEREGFLAEARSAFRTTAELDPSYKDVKSRTQTMANTGTSRALKAPEAAWPPPRNPPPIPPSPMPQQPPAPPQQPRSVSSPGRLTPANTALPTPDWLSAAQAVRTAPVESPAPSKTDLRAQLSSHANINAEPQPLIPTIANLMGITLHGRFRVEKMLGSGSQAIVCRARDMVTNRPVAIKILSSMIEADDESLERFLREVKLAARVHHPNCIAVYDFGRERGLTFMAMEYFEGATLYATLRNGRISPATGLKIALQVAQALTAVHKEGIVHRDIKPGNIMIGADGDVRLTDFGIAKHIGEETNTGLMIGTISYMAPEQASGKDVDSRTDIFALGVVLYEMLCGARPWGSDIESLAHRAFKPPPPLRGELVLPEIVQEAVTKCLQPNPAHRYPSLEPLIGDLEVAIDMLDELEQEPELPEPGE